MTIIQEEMEAIHINKTCKLLNFLKGWKVIGYKWGYKTKQDDNDKEEQYDASTKRICIEKIHWHHLDTLASC